MRVTAPASPCPQPAPGRPESVVSSSCLSSAPGPACPGPAPVPGQLVTTPGRAGRASPRRRLLAGTLSVLIVAGVFAFALPRVASYGAVWDSLRSMTWPWLGVIGLTMVASLVTTWLMIAAVIPSLRLRNAATVNLGSSAVANTLPGGGAVA